MLAGSIMLWAVTDVFFGTLWNVMWRNVWRSYKHIEDKEVHTVRTFCTKDPKGTKGEECWRSVGRFWRPTRRWYTSRHIFINMLWKIALVLVLCKASCLRPTQYCGDFWLINFNTLIFEAFLRFLITQDDLKSNNLVTPRRDRRTRL